MGQEVDGANQQNQWLHQEWRPGRPYGHQIHQIPQNDGYRSNMVFKSKHS